MTLRKRVGANIRALRTAKGWSQEKLAWSSKLTSDYLGSLERGTVNTSLDSIERIAKSLGVDPQVLLKK